MRFSLPLLLVLALSVAGCMSPSGARGDEARSFTITVENVSTPNTIASARAMGTVPLSPPTYAVFRGADPMFVPGQMANAGTERIAEDGFPDEMLAILGAASNVSASGAQPSPGGPDDGPALFAGESATFTVMARPGDKLQMGTMFVQSNDWFYGFSNGGIDLFNGTTPVSGDVTSRLVLYDAGTEQDTAPGTGANQKPAQDPMATNVGPDESVAIRPAAQRHSAFTIPSNNQVIRVTISS